jgi:hypothetical protein
MPIYPIVGAHYRPPAKALLQSLPAGTPLEVRPEPSNEFDPNAQAIWLKSDAIPPALRHEASALALAAVGYGFSIEDLMREPEWHLGYIPAKDAAGMRNTKPLLAKLAFTLEAKPAVKWEDMPLREALERSLKDE